LFGGSRRRLSFANSSSRAFLLTVSALVLAHAFAMGRAVEALPRGPLFFVYKTPYGTHQMGNRDVNTTFPENLRNPVDAQLAAVSFQDLFVALPQRVDLRLRWMPVN
jgi:hypothetical protein